MTQTKSVPLLPEPDRVKIVLIFFKAMTQYFSVQKTFVLAFTLLSMSQATSQLSGKAIAQEIVPEALQLSQMEPEQPDLLLYGGPRTRSPLVQWYLEELEIPYQYVSLDIQAGENREPDFLSINPTGKVPAIMDGDFKVWESGAILLYLADKHGEIPDSIEDRAVINQWVIFANATLSPGLFREEQREREMPILLTPLNDILEQQSFLLGSELSVADVAVGSYLYYAKVLLSLDFSDYPAVETYLDSISQRPAFQNTLGQLQ